ncbi:MAG: hypothetical protein M1818_002272 [Claussenomyces sp. TS43310]|nr:MAG: hypothetical protein M1818_002272 [Claussenomyces sp. TS43310]
MILSDSDQPARNYLRFSTSNVPGDATRRHLRLMRDFYAFIGRELSDVDHAHIPGLIDSPDEVAWMVFDLNVGERNQDLEDIPVRCWKVNYYDEIP